MILLLILTANTSWNIAQADLKGYNAIAKSTQLQLDTNVITHNNPGTKLSSPCIKQCKGEAELALVDCKEEYVSDMEEGSFCASIATPGDIDAVKIHILCHLWPRNRNNTYQHLVYIILKKIDNY